jgi:SAM-dependent methyltransferase
MKMGYYPTPEKTLEHLEDWLDFPHLSNRRIRHILDPCCGKGAALASIKKKGQYTHAYGIELDVDRAMAASEVIQTFVQGSIFSARINPLGSMGLLFLNPPYDVSEGEREEMKFLKQSIKWLVSGGILVFIVPELLFGYEKYRAWIGQHFDNITIVKVHRDDYPQFKQVVLFGVKKEARTETGMFPDGPYPYIEGVEPKPYEVPPTNPPEVFQGEDTVTDEDIAQNSQRLYSEIARIAGSFKDARTLSPIIPLRKAHLVCLITAGVLDGKIDTGKGGFLLLKGFTERVEHTRVEDDKEITTCTYNVGIRAINPGEGRWYEIK